MNEPIEILLRYSDKLMAGKSDTIEEHNKILAINLQKLGLSWYVRVIVPRSLLQLTRSDYGLQDTSLFSSFSRIGNFDQLTGIGLEQGLPQEIVVLITD